MASCEYCGKDLKEHAKFCEHCGSAISGTESAEPKVETAAESPVQAASYQPPVEPTAPQQGSYQPPVEPTAPQQGSYQPPVGQSAPQQGGYQPPVGQSAPQQGGYQPPMGQSAPQQGGYQPPMGQSAPQQGGYQPPVGQSAPQQGGYQPPVGQNAPQQGGRGQGGAVKQRKAPNKRVILFGGIALVLVVLIAVVAMLMSRGGESVDDSNPFVGVWRAVSVEMWGETMTAEDVFGGAVELELKANGKCEFRADGDKDTYSWEEKSGEILVTSGGETVLNCLKDSGRLVVEDFMGTGITIIFEKGDGSSAGKAEPPVKGESTPTQEKWNGDWYGYLYFFEAYGEWSMFEGDLYDAYMVLDVDKSGNGTMEIEILVEGEIVSVVDADIFADEYHFEVTFGEFWDFDLSDRDWWLGTSPVDEGELVVISDIYIDPELYDGDGFEYMFQFRPWGERWEQEEQEVERGSVASRLPPSYADYLSEIASSGSGKGLGTGAE